MPGARKILRFAHLAVGIWIAIFIFSPLRLDDTATFYARISLVGLTLSGWFFGSCPGSRDLSGVPRLPAVLNKQVQLRRGFHM